MVTVWWSTAGAIHYNFLQPGQTITVDYHYPIHPIVELYRKLKESGAADTGQQKRSDPAPRQRPPARFTNHKITKTKIKRIERRSSVSPTKLSRPLANRLPIFSSTSITFLPIEPWSIRTRQNDRRRLHRIPSTQFLCRRN